MRRHRNEKYGSKRLRFDLLLTIDASEIACKRDAIIFAGFSPEFLEFFDGVNKWVNSVKAMSGEEVFALASEIIETSEAPSFDLQFAKLLKNIAATKKYPPALRYRVEYHLNTSNKYSSPCRAADTLAELAKLGDEDAGVVANSPPGLFPNPVPTLDEIFAAVVAAALSVVPMRTFPFQHVNDSNETRDIKKAPELGANA